MSLFRDAMRPSLTADEAVRRYVERIRADIEPDPLFRRRLRGEVTNRFVAVRERIGVQPVERHRMGTLGRACLYASFALAVSVGSAMAASRAAIPGDLLYPMKLEIEELRARVLPAEFQDDLAAFTLGERIHELRRLAEDGNWAAIPALVEQIGAGYEQLEAMGIGALVTDAELARRLEVLEMLRSQLPAQAQAAIQRALAHDPPHGAAGRQDGEGTSATQGDNSHHSVPAIVEGADSEPPDQHADTGTSSTAKPSPTPRPAPTARPTPTPDIAGNSPDPGAAAKSGDRPEDDSQD